jgi:sulfite dehydrogenase (cytochrome) subunit B
LHAAFAAAALTVMDVCRAEPLTYALPDETASLRPGPGMETARNNCLTCHSTDYISTQPPHRGEAFWQAEVTKMIKAYRAPISDGDAKIIVEYLAKTY